MDSLQLYPAKWALSQVGGWLVSRKARASCPSTHLVSVLCCHALHCRDRLDACGAVARHVYREYGLSGFWIGTQASLVMVVNPTLQYALYEWLTTARKKLK